MFCRFEEAYFTIFCSGKKKVFKKPCETEIADIKMMLQWFLQVLSKKQSGSKRSKTMLSKLSKITKVSLHSNKSKNIFCLIQMQLFQCFSFDRKMINKPMLLLHSSLDLLTLPGPNENTFTSSYTTAAIKVIKFLFKAIFTWIANHTRQINDIAIKITPKLLGQGRKQITELSLVTNCILKYANHRRQDNTCSVYVSCYKAMIVAVLKYMSKTGSSIIKH